MKKLFLIGITCFAMQAHAQYFHRFFNETILFPPFRDEAFDDGLKSRVNYAGGDPQNYYFAATGSSEMAIGGNSDARLRFLHTAKNGTAKANTAFQFADVTPKWYETRGKDLCEIDNGQGTGGYIIVGEVNDNPATDALGIPGFTDWFFGKFTNSGGVSTKKRIDIDSGADVAHGVIRSLAVAGTYLVCGYSIKAAHVNAVVARITDAGAVVWLRSFNFVTPQVPCYTTSQCFAYSLCENPATGEIYVCGTIAGHKPGADRDGLLFAVSSAGFPLWQIYHDAGQSYDEYHDIKFTSNGYLLVCGFSDLATNLPNPFNDTWISLFAPGAMPAAIGMIWSIKHRMIDQSGNASETRGFRVIEGKRPNDSTLRYYVAGPNYGGTLNQMLLETSVRTTDYAPIGGTYHVYPVPYGPLRYDYRFGLDSVEMSAPRPGLIIFSSTQQPITGGVSDGSLLKTYYNGGTCTNYCQNNPDVLFTIGPHQAMDECDQSIYNVVNLKRITYPYSQGITCTQNMVACGSNSKLDNEDEESMDDLMDDLDEGEIIVYPNPASDQLSIAMAATTSGDYQIEIVDLTGKIMESSVVYFGAGTSVVKFDLSDYTPGYYLISISGADLNIRKTFVKQ